MIKLALVDFDGTLADSMPFWVDLGRESLALRGHEEPEGLRELVCTLSMQDTAPWIIERFPDMGPRERLIDEWYDIMEGHYARDISPRPGAFEFLRRLREKGCAVWILSATRLPSLEKGVDGMGFRPYVDRILSARETGPKGDGSAYRFCMAQSGLAADEILLVEDSFSNLRSGREAGLRTVGIRDESMDPWADIARENSDAWLEDFSDLSELNKLL